MTYGTRLQQAMDAATVDRKTLASALGVTVHAVGMVITGGGREERWLSRENNLAAASFLRVDPHWLATGEGQEKPTGKAKEPHGYTVEALALAWLLDQVTDRLDKTIANHAASAAILEVLQKTGEAPTHTPERRVTPKKHTA